MQNIQLLFKWLLGGSVAVVIQSSAWAGGVSFPAKVDNQVLPQIESRIDGNIRTETSKLTCWGSRITIITKLKKVREDTGQALSQELIFKESNGSTTEHLFKYSDIPEGEGDMIVDAHCHQGKTLRFVELRSTNFGNCRGCEWIDYFTTNREYKGSQKSGFPKGAVNFIYHKLDRQTEVEIGSEHYDYFEAHVDKNGHPTSVDINRVFE